MRRTFTPKFVMLRISSSVATNVFVRAAVIYTFGLLLFFAMCGMVRAQTTLSIGDVQTLGTTSDASDSFSFVLWKDIAAGTVLRFMDHSFTNATTGVNGTENDMSLTFSSALTAGTVVSVVDTGTTLVNGGTFSGTKTGSLSGIAADGDQVFIYQGTAVGGGTSFTGRTLLHGFNVANTSWLTSGTASAQASYIPTVITVADASFDSGNFDNVDYTGARTGLTTAAFRAAVSNITNYTQNDTRFDLATGGFTISSATSLHWDADGSTIGNGGTGTWDTTTADLFKNGASGTTFLRWVNSSDRNDHTAVFGGTAGTVSLASGGVTVSGLQFDTTGYTLQNNTLTLTGASPVVTITSGITTLNSVVTGTSGFEKTGAGTLVLGGENTLSGTVQVTAGSLAVKNTAGSATGSGNVTATGSTILGTGRISPASGGSVIFGGATIVAVGDSGDTSGKTLIFTPASGTMSTTFQTNSVLELDLFTGAGSGDNSGIGAAADTLQWGGTLALGSNVKLRVNNPNNMTGFAAGDSWKALDWTTFGGSAPSGTFETSLLELPSLTGLLAWDTSLLTSNGTLSIIQVPEPSRAALMLGGGFSLVFRRGGRQGES
jgi:autotransporter-associated beta strand protein